MNSHVKHKTHKSLLEKLEKKGEAYRKSDSVAEREKLSAELGDLQTQLKDHLADGAKACPDGKEHRVIGMLKTPDHWDSTIGMQIPDLYEVGCVNCPPVLVEREDGKDVNGTKVKRWSHSARGWSPQEAVEKWNKGEWVEDFHTDRVPTQTIFKP